MSEVGSDSRGNDCNGSDAEHELHRELHRRFRSRGPDARDAYNQLLVALSSVVRPIADRVGVRYRVDADDLFQDAWLNALVPAVNTYDPSKNCRISTFVTGCVYRRVARQARRLARHRRELMPAGDGSGEDGDVFHQVPSPAPVDELEQAEKATAVQAAIKLAFRTLTATERKVMRLLIRMSRSGRPKTHRQIAQVLGVDRSRVSQIVDAARSKLRNNGQLCRLARECGYDVDKLLCQEGESCRPSAALVTRSR
jgi:RNA polymerase sigma factor (sigma-70 family)